MTLRSTITTALIAVAVIGGGTVWYLHRGTPPGCTSEAALNRVYDVLHKTYQLDSIYLNNIRPVSGGYFSDHHACSAEVATIRGNQKVEDLPWHAVRFTIAPQDGDTGPAVAVTLGGPTPFVRQKPSFWERLLGGT